MSALVGRTVVAPGESVGLLEVAGAETGTMYSVIVLSEGSLVIIPSEDSTETYDLENRKAYVTDAEILVKNVSGVARALRVVAIPQGEGADSGPVKVGRGTLAPGETAGLLDLADAEPGSAYVVSVMGRYLSIVSEDGTEDFELETHRDYLTNAEIYVKNTSPIDSTTVAVLAIPAVVASGGGGGGDVASVNGKTGEVVLALDDLIEEAGTLVENGLVIFMDDSGSPLFAASLTHHSLTLQDTSTNSVSELRAGWLSLQEGSKRGRIQNPEEDGEFYVTLPSASGTLALTSDITAPNLTEVLVQGGEVAYGQGFQFLNESEELRGLLDYDSGFMHINPAGIAASVGGGVVGASNLSTSDSVQVSSTEISYGKSGQGYKRLRIGDGDATQKIIELPSSSGTLALTSDIPEGGGIPEGGSTGEALIRDDSGDTVWGYPRGLRDSSLGVGVGPVREGYLQLDATDQTNAASMRIVGAMGMSVAILVDENEEPLDSSSEPSGVVVQQVLENRVPDAIPAAPTTGTHVLKSVDGVLTWVEEV